MPLEARRNQWVCVCWGFLAPVATASVMEGVPFGVKGYDNEVNGSHVKDDMEVFGYGVRSGWSCNCDSATMAS